MVLEVISTNQTTTYTIDSGDNVVLLDGVALTSSSTGFSASHDGSIDLSILGDVITQFQAIDIGLTSTSAGTFELFIGSTGSLMALDDYAIDLNRTATDINNAGEIFADYGGIVYRTGVLSGRLANTGLIHSDEGYGVAALGGTGTGDFDFHNTGTIWGRDGAIAVSYNNLTVTNTGTLMGDAAIVHAFAATFGTSASITNIGSIVSTGLTAISLNTGDDTVVNSGSIVGQVLLAGGNDTFDGRGGSVTGPVFGGSGNDTFVIDDAAADIRENAGEGTDEVQSEVTYTLGLNFENLTLLGGEALNGFGNDDANDLTGNQSNNLLGGRDGNDSIRGEGGDDTLIGGYGQDTLVGGDGADFLQGNADGDRLFGLNGDDSLSGGYGDDSMYGQNGEDTLTGGQGADFLGGGGGNDNLDGGAGFDTLNGSAGDDRLTGGLNADQFVFDDAGGGFGNDTITDFEENNNSEDIDLSGVAAIANYTDLITNHMTQVGANVVIDDLAGNTITILNVNIADLQEADFVFF